MSEICNPACLTDQIRTYPQICDQRTATRKGGFEVFGVLDCSVIITDLTEEAEWAALKCAGTLVTSPPGFGSLVQPEATNEKLRACGPEELIDEVSGFDWRTVLFDNTNFYDFNFENDMKNLYRNKTVFWIGCDGLLYLRYGWTAGTNPGFGGFVPSVFRTSEPDNLQALNINIRFNTYREGIRGIAVPAAVISAILDECEGSGGGGIE
jgi:hypothetical protein